MACGQGDGAGGYGAGSGGRRERGGRGRGGDGDRGTCRQHAGANRGSADVEMAAHEFTTAIRYSFWRVPFFEDRE